MDIVVTVIIAAITFTLSFIGILITLKPPNWAQIHRPSITVFFIAGSVAAIALTAWLGFLAHASSEESRKDALGDTEHPPWVGVLSWPGFTRFIITNNSDHPAYISSIELVEDTAFGSGGEKRSYGSIELPAHAARTDDRPWIPLGKVSHHHFVATITTRAGLFREEMMLDHAENNQWARAVRVMQGMRTLDEDIDSAWPRNSMGEVDWKP